MQKGGGKMRGQNPDSIGNVRILSVEEFETLLNGHVVVSSEPHRDNLLRIRSELEITHVFLDPCASGRWDPLKADMNRRQEKSPLGRNCAGESILQAFLRVYKPRCVLLISECCGSGEYKQHKIRELSPDVIWYIPDCISLAYITKGAAWSTCDQARQVLIKSLREAKILA
jgi:hypothetical protein